MRIELFGESAIDSRVIAKHVRGGSARNAYLASGINRSEERPVHNRSADQLSSSKRDQTGDGRPTVDEKHKTSSKIAASARKEYPLGASETVSRGMAPLLTNRQTSSSKHDGLLRKRKRVKRSTSSRDAKAIGGD